MPLHPVIEKALAAAAGTPAYSEMSIKEARALAQMGYPPNPAPVSVGAVRDVFIPGPGGAIPVRLYTPSGDGPHPIVLYFHGSGFVLLGLDSHDDVCRRLCAGADCLVASVDYRLAPENPYPAAPDDALAATRWMADNAAEFTGDASRMVVAGDSAGACLAAVTALRIRAEGGPELSGQLLFYPVTDYPSAPGASYQSYGSGYGLTNQGMRWFWQQYLPEASGAAHEHVSPLRVREPAGLPSACVLTAEYDVLHDEGMAYASRLADAGVPVVSRSYAGMNHGFLKYAGVIPVADAAIDEACRWLKATARQVPARHG